MAKLRIKLTRNLRRSIQQGHPWVYREAIVPLEGASKNIDRAQLAQVLDSKGELAWAIYDPHSPLALRILSTEKFPPSSTNGFFHRRFERSLKLRSGVRNELTTGFRLFNGEGDVLPGLVCDVYGDTAVLQFDGQGPGEFWNKNEIAEWILANVGEHLGHGPVKTVIEKSRRSSERTAHHVAGDEKPSLDVVMKENGALYEVNLEKGQKTGFFLDQRDNRFFVRQNARGKTLLNLFSYTGGFSIAAGLGGADKVASLDISQAAITSAEKNWALNGLESSRHEGLAIDVFEYLTGDHSTWDHIIVDPPSMSHSEERKEIAVAKYTELFAAAAKRVVPLGELSLSSCSSHISFDDFFKIITEAMSQARRRGRILRVSGQGADHPFPHACPELRYLKFVHLALD
ncbi:MAG: class I SAM-dependent rRNA methyltransferase [Bdellovibrionales bacterium]|jgi:23S rRNA (cytosine1962-C5)-methyltransferase|nr:class I SAM-dependent rRNA methyltransferase [Bdellovibrionales bacterium]